MEEDKLKKELDQKYDCYILIGQKKEFGKTDLYLNAYSLSIMSLVRNACKLSPVLKETIKDIVNDD